MPPDSPQAGKLKMVRMVETDTAGHLFKLWQDELGGVAMVLVLEK